MALVSFEVTKREAYAAGRDFGDVGSYEQLDGVAHFLVDPQHPANAAIVDLDLATTDDAGMVPFRADLSVLVPTDQERSNGRIIVELPNRGRRLFVPTLNLAPRDAPLTQQVDPGDGFLFEQGYTVASIGWQWDVVPTQALLGLEAPMAMQRGGQEPVTGQTMVEIRPNEPEMFRLLADRVHRPLLAASGAQPEATLYVREYEDAEDIVVDRSRWQFAKVGDNGDVTPSNEHVYFADGFEPGRIYQLVYETDCAPIAGVGLIALRDLAQFLRTPSDTNPYDQDVRAMIAWGVSQTGRMLRHFVSLGLNVCEDGSKAYDGLQPHVAGARRGAFNHRFAQPSNQTTPLWGHVFPFADESTTDSLSGAQAGLLDRLKALDAVPKIISTNSSAEYWRGDASLAHVSTDGRQDLPEHADTRSYLFASTQHSAGYLGQSRVHPGLHTVARYDLNVLDYRPLLRAALVNLDKWITEGIEPPPSLHPRLSDGSAVRRERVLAYFAHIPGMAAPHPRKLPFLRTVDMGCDEATGVGSYPAKEGEFYPALVSKVDSNGNEIAGIRLPDVTHPVGSHSGWNSRDPSTGAPEQIVPMNGLTMFFSRTEEERKQKKDSRLSIEERYDNKSTYEKSVRAAAAELVQARYLLPADAEVTVQAALERYDAAMAVLV